MKRIIFFLFALLPLFAIGQRLETMPRPGEVPPGYRAEYRKLLNAYEREAAQLRSEGWDIILPPEEQVPTLISTAGILAQTNWGEQTLLPSDIRARILNECKYKVLIKITDTGGKLSHADLQAGQLPGKSYTGEALLEDGNGHSTHVAGIIAGRDLGLAYELVKKNLLTFKPVKILTDGGSGSFTWAANAYASERAEDLQFKAAGTTVIYSGSFGGGTTIVGAVETELQKSVDAGIMYIYASGNTGAAVNYPAMSPLAIAAASLDQSMVVSSYSSRGPQVANAMPGRNINSTYKDNTYAILSGTSMATPFLSAAAAIAVSKWGPWLLPNQSTLKGYFAKIATDIPPPGKDDPSGFGVLFIRAILDTPPSGTPPPPPPPVDPPAPTPVVQVMTNVTGYAIRYRFAGQVADNILHIRRVTLYADGKTAEESIENARAACAKYFPTHVIAEIPVKDGLQGAGYWSGQFLEYYGRNNAMPLQVESIEVSDELGRSFIVTGFDRAELPPAYDSTLPRLLKR